MRTVLDFSVAEGASVWEDSRANVLALRRRDFERVPQPVVVRATRAYIASLGTTGVLVASSALLLVVVSALMAFNAWPGGDPISGIKGLVVDNREPSLQLTGPARVAADAAPAAAAVAAAPPVGTAAPGPRG